MSQFRHVALADLLGSFALSAIEVQQLWNQGAHALFAPARLILTEWQVEAKLSLAAARETGFTLQAQPLNLAFERIYQETQANCSLLRFQVEQVPAPLGGIEA